MALRMLSASLPLNPQICWRNFRVSSWYTSRPKLSDRSSSMIGDGLWCCLCANRSSRYDAPEGRMAAVTRLMSKMLLGWNFFRLSKAKADSIWKIPIGLLTMSAQTAWSSQSISWVWGYGLPRYRQVSRMTWTVFKTRKSYLATPTSWASSISNMRHSSPSLLKTP